ncbi:Na+/phosphate symporter [Elusimicrobium simillimum]|uniref:hypothetical protein n=1 Tax=Elusimicrobium simillimum TaxID=3143438 RepID=UPI003C6F4787
MKEKAKINTLRNKLRDERNLQTIKREDVSAISSTHYADIISRLERIGDHALRVIDNSISKKTPEKERREQRGYNKKVLENIMKIITKIIILTAVVFTFAACKNNTRKTPRPRRKDTGKLWPGKIPAPQTATVSK